MERKYNFGIALLKALAAASVVWSHFGVGFGRATLWAVPTFVMLSCYLTSDVICGGDGRKLGRRLLRFWIPSLTWGVLAWIVGGLLDRGWDPWLLGLQLAFGHTVCPPLYYLIDLVVVTTVLWGCRRIAKGCGVFCLVIAVSYAIQYGGVSVRLFGGLDESCRYTLGRIFELLPFGACGLLIKEWMPHRPRLCAGGLLALGMGMFCVGLIWAKWIDVRFAGFAYSGMGLALEAVGISLVFILADEVWPQLEVSRISIPARLCDQSSGVYFLHHCVGSVAVVGLGLERGLKTCVLVWLVSLVGSALLSRLKQPRILGI